MKRTTFLAAALATGLAWATPSAADTILFDIDGTGPSAPINALEFDWFAGNTLVQINPTNPTVGRVLYQANLNTVQTDQGQGIGASGPGSFLTIVAAFDVSLSLTASGVDFAVVNNGQGVIRLYADNERGNNLTGVGFAGIGDANAVNILTATITSGSGTFGFTTAAPVDLDQFTSTILGPVPEAGGNNYLGVLTRTGEGGSQFNATVQSFNNAYFLNLAVGSSVMFTNSSGIDPYRQANPSDAFSSNAQTDANLTNVITGGTICGLGPGCVNGTGFNFVAQSDSNSTFTLAPGVVPEPATLTLLGLGLIGAAAVRRRANKK